MVEEVVNNMCWHSSVLRIYCFAYLDFVFGRNWSNFNCVSVHEVRAWFVLAHVYRLVKCSYLSVLGHGGLSIECKIIKYIHSYAGPDQ